MSDNNTSLPNGDYQTDISDVVGMFERLSEEEQIKILESLRNMVGE